MAPSHKNRQKPPQSVTLHNFFIPGGEPSSKRKAQGEKSSGNQKLKTAAVGPPGEIIVIDSSDDDRSPVTSGVRTQKKRRLSESSGEVEFVDHIVVKPPPLGRFGVSAKGTSSTGGTKPGDFVPSLTTGVVVGFGQPSALLRSNPPPMEPAEVQDPPAFAFGPPILLGGSSNQNRNTIESFSFGSPTSLLHGRPLDKIHRAPTSNVTESPFVSHPSQPLQTSEVQTTPGANMLMDVDLYAELNNDWDAGDDEMALVDTSCNDELEELVMNLSDSTNTAEINHMVCPICGEQLRGVPTDSQSHVNECLDKTLVQHLSASTPITSTPFPPPPPPLPPYICGPLQQLSYGGKSSLTRSGNDAFSVLMSSSKESEAWKEASIAEDRAFRPTKSSGGRRKAPFYKVLQGMPVAVDAFCYGMIPGVTAYFLTHAHSDHYTSLSSAWKSGLIYCSEGTANLIIHMLSVDKKWVCPLPMDVPFVIPSTGGVRVTLIEANHCPGSCLFLFEGPQTVDAGDSEFKSPFVGSSRIFRYLHCGDFRASPRHVLHPGVRGKRIDYVYLDTTYLDPKYTFPPQPLVVSACAELARRIASGQSIDEKSFTMDTWMTNPQDDASGKQKGERVLMVVGTYSIGKERIVKAIAHALKTKVFCDARKAAILRCQPDPDLHALLTSDPLDADVHLVPLGVITSDKFKAYVERYKGTFSRAVGFRPTGWTYNQPAGTNQTPSVAAVITRSQKLTFTHADIHPSRTSTSTLQLFPIPYSEHSSFFELTCFAMSFEWGKMIATVNVGRESSRGKMAKWFERWEVERRNRVEDAVVAYRDVDYW